MLVLTKPVFVLKNLPDTKGPTNFSLSLAFRKLDNIDKLKFVGLVKGELMPQVSFDKDIKPLMTEADRNHMEFMFDLWSYKDVKDNADDIYDSVSNGRMPPPQGGGPWSKDKVDLFKQWMDGDYQP
jgi:hypothetical protein